jgi:flagellar biosynthetic protein FlhB
MSEDSGQEKTEDASARRLEQAREKGQVARSKELTAFVMTLTGCMVIMMTSTGLIQQFSELAQLSFAVPRDVLMDKQAIVLHVTHSILGVASQIFPLLVTLFFAALISGVLIGGLNFSTQALMPSFSRLDPIKGMARMFSAQSMMEMFKALAKFLLIAGVAIWVMVRHVGEISALADQDINNAMAHSLSVTAWSFIAVSFALLLLVAIDVPFQLWNFFKQLKMSKQELKDEYKETEGKPEVKSRIRQMQRQIAQRRMMEKVPQADVVITNPTHYAVALRYQTDSDAAPIVVAKGQDLIAQRIKQIAGEHNITLIEAPPLARAVYFSTKLNQQIPSGLYVAVAQALAYVYQMNQFKRGFSKQPARQPDFPIPPELRKDD